MPVTEMIVALGVCVFLPIAVLIAAYLFRRVTSRERLLAIEKGVPIPFEAVDPRERAARTRRWGIILIGLGIGIIACFAVMAAVEDERDALVASGFGIIPVLIGAGLLIDFRLRTKELDAAEARTLAGPDPR